MSLARNRSLPESRPSSHPERRVVMEFAGHRGSSAGAAGLLVVPGPNYPDLDVDLDDEDEDIVIRIRPKSSPQPRRKTSLDEEDSDISEPPSLSGSRRVSFADAVGLSLVQIKEFGKWDVPQLPDFLDSISKDQEEYFISPFNFTLSSSSEEIAAKVTDHKVELESIELLPGTTILKGVIRVLNISFTKAVYVRISLDNWVSHFDLLSEYIPGSSEGQTDSFSFKLTLVPPFAEQGARVDFCLRYETPCGTFWTNNGNRNYVLFCYKRKKEVQDKPQKENVKKSCLKTVSPSFSVEESMSSPEQEDDAPDATIRQSNNDSQSNESISSPAERSEEDGSLSQVENRQNHSRRNRRKAAKVARVRDYFGQKDLTTQDSETQSSSETQTETAQEQNIEKRHSDCKGNIQLEDNADALLLNSSNNKQHEKLNPADAAISTDESEVLPNTAPTLHQNINKFVSSSSEERGPEAASDSTRLSGERVDSEKLVSDSGGFAFGTVVAPLYHQVSCRVGGQIHSETRSSAFTKDQREAGGRSSSGEMNDCRDVGLNRDDKKVESIEQCRAMMDIVEMPKDLKELENVPNPMNSLLNLSEKILDVESELQDEKLSLDIQVTFAHAAAQAHSFENIISHDKNKDETVLITGEQQSPHDIEKQPCQCDSPENNVVVASSLTNTLIQEENIALPSQTSQNECWQKLESSCKDLSLEFVDKTLPIALEDITGKSQEDNVSLLLQPLHNEGFSDQFINITDNIKEPSIDGAKSDIFNDENPLLTSEDLPSSLDPPSNLSNIMQERGLEIDKKTMTSPSHAHEVAEDTNPSLLLEHTLADESVKVTSLSKEKSLDTDAGIVLSNHISITSTEQNPLLTSQLAEKGNSANHPNLSQVFDSQTMAASSTTASETPEEKLLLEQNEDLGKKSRHNKSAPKSQIQEMEECVENSFVLLGQNSSVPVSSTNSCNYVKEHDDLAGTVVLPTSASKLYVENSPLSLQLSHNDKFTGPDELNVHHAEKMDVISQNHALTESESVSQSKQLSQNEELRDQSKNSSKPNNLDLDHELSKTVALSACDKSLSFTEENPYLPIQVLENQPPNTKDLVAHPYERPEFTETMAILPKKEGENSIGHIDPSAQEMIANSVAFVEVMEERVATSCKGIVDEEIRPLNIVLSNKNVTMLSVGEIAKSKAENDNCVTETTKFATDNVIEVTPEDVEQCEMSQMNTLEDEPKKLKIVIGKEKEDFNYLILHTGNEEMIQEVQSNLVEDVVWQVSDTNINLERAEQLEKAKVLSFKTEEDAMNELERAQEPTSRNEECFDSPFETEMLALCPDDEENEGDQASESRSTSGAMNEKELNESIARQIVGYDVDYKEEEQVLMHWETDEEERSEILPCKVECNLSAPMDNVQVGIESSPEKVTIETPDMPTEIDKTDFPHDTKDWSEGASQAQGSTFTENLKYEQTCDNDNSHSDTDSGSEDEMELYMHCLRAVYGQQSSPKATRPEQNREKEFKKMSISRSKRSSTSLPSISESLDEEQQCFKQENDPERVEVQPAAPLLPDSSHKEEIDKYLWWKETFSCRSVLKAMLYAILLLVFLAVAYHYDFIACFGLYVISVIWLFFQGERQTGKNNKAT